MVALYLISITLDSLVFKFNSNVLYIGDLKVVTLMDQKRVKVKVREWEWEW